MKVEDVGNQLFGVEIQKETGDIEKTGPEVVNNQGDMHQQRNERSKKRRQGKKTKDVNQKGVRGNYTLNPLIRDNDVFFDYCRRQKIVPDDEFQEFQNIMRIDLPASFRIQRSLAERDEFVNLLETQFLQPLRSSEEDVHCPEKIPFIPYAYQTDNTRAAIRSSAILSKLHQLLISETTIGCISRQEAVSMVPPLLLDIQPHHYVLDACASPGSKTAQISELMHENNKSPTGLLVANDVDNSRCYLLVHQTLKRLPTANCVVTNHDASCMPAPLDKDGNVRHYDRILCDVVCSGDGTFRKNLELWKCWNPGKALNLHRLQRHIANRCFELLEVDGLMAYSTCSLNPIEDEAVLAYLFRKYKGFIELVDVSDQLPELKRSPGLLTWKVLNSGMKEYATFEDAQNARDKYIVESMFPLSEDEAKEFHLERSFRILPHAQNSGGFFVAIIRKTANLSTKIDIDMRKFRRAPAKKRRTLREDPFLFLSDNDAGFKEELNDIYGIGPSFPFENLLVRNENADNKRAIYFVNDALRDFMQCNQGRFNFINAGVGVMRKMDKIGCSNYRLSQNGLTALFPYITKRIIELDVEDMSKVLSGFKEKHFVALADLKDKDKFNEVDSGSVVLQIKRNGFTKEVCAWKGASTVSAFVSHEEKIHLLSVLGCDISALQTCIQTSRKEKAQKLRDVAARNNRKDEEEEYEANGNSFIGTIAEEQKEVAAKTERDAEERD